MITKPIFVQVLNPELKELNVTEQTILLLQNKTYLVLEKINIL